jgi:hypothetical protein
LKKNIHNSFERLKHYVEQQHFKGWDPYDGLNSWMIQKTFLGKSRFFRLAWIQLFKRNPINFRPIVGIEKGYNPKGLGLFLTGYCNLYKIDKNPEHVKTINLLANKLIELQTKGYSGACWGYNFDWQARAFYQPKYTPTIVATSFIGEALFEAYDITKNLRFLETAISTSDFVLKDLNKSYDDHGDFTLSYSPLDTTQVYNAGLLGAKLLSLIFKHTNDILLIENAKKIVSYVCKKQNKDGSWPYGSLPFHQWIDNFHTGFNLECINVYKTVTNDTSFDHQLKIGMDYYLNTFFTPEGLSKYYNNKTFPIDIHAPAQLVVTLSKFGLLLEQKPLVDKVVAWTINNMQSKEGYFYYQRKKYTTSKIPYIRWAQAWMFYALSYYKLEVSENG